MADRAVVLCAPLCFIANRIGSTEIKVLKNVLKDYYGVDDIAVAKQRLIEDADIISGKVDLPHRPRLPKHTGEDRLIRDIEDIIQLYTFLDERKVCNELPIYATDSPDSVPCLRIVDGNFKLLVAKLDNMADQIAKLQETVTVLQSGMCTTPCSIDKSTSVGGMYGLDRRPQPHTEPSGCGYLGSSMVTGQAEWPGLSGSSSQQLGNSTMSHSNNTGTRHVDWATRTSVTNHQPISSMNSSHVESSVVHSREPVIAANGELSSQDDSSMLFQPVISRSARRRDHKRQRVHSSEDNADNDRSETAATAGNDTSNASRKSTKRSTTLLVGKKKLQTGISTSSTEAVLAANPYLGKAVYCIDNVSTDVKEDDMRKFINDLGVHLISCFKVAPRRPGWWDKKKEYKPNRNTFRVCIPKHESDKLLNEDIWPEFISVSTWIFKNRSLSVDSDTRRQQPSSPTRSMLQSKSSEQAGGVALSNRWSALEEQPDSDSEYSAAVINQEVDDMETTVHYVHGADQ